MKKITLKSAALATALALGGFANAAEVTKNLTFKGPDKASPRIVGGDEATPGEFPWIVSLQSTSGSHFCGASLIADKYVLTAAHCIEGASPSQLQVALGIHSQANSPSKQVLQVEKIIPHQSYDGNALKNDIAILKLKTAADARFSRIKLATAAIMNGGAAPGKNSTVAGWGTLQSGGNLPDKLQKVDVPIVSLEQCRAGYSQDQIHESNVCAGLKAGGKDSCQGDSGGPLFIKDNNEHYQVGVVSWGEGCALPNKYGVYTRAESFTQWIADAMAGNTGGGSGGGTGGGTGGGSGGGTTPGNNDPITVEDDSVVMVSNLSLEQGKAAAGEIEVPAGAEYLLVTTFGGEGDVDLLVAYNREATEEDADYVAFTDGNNEDIYIPFPRAGKYKVKVSAYADSKKVNFIAKHNKVEKFDDLPE